MKTGEGSTDSFFQGLWRKLFLKRIVLYWLLFCTSYFELLWNYFYYFSKLAMSLSRNCHSNYISPYQWSEFQGKDYMNSTNTSVRNSLVNSSNSAAITSLSIRLEEADFESSTKKNKIVISRNSPLVLSPVSESQLMMNIKCKPVASLLLSWS